MPSSPHNTSDVTFRRDIHDLVQTFIGLLSPEGTLLGANQSALNFIGLDIQEIVGMPFWETPWWQACAQSRAAVKDAVRRGAAGEAVRFEARVGGKTGDVIDIAFSLTPIFDDAGAVISLVPEGHDITAIKQAENALQKSEARLRLGYDTAGMGTWDWDLTTDRLYWSDRQFELFCLPKPQGEMTIDLALATIHPDDLERVTTSNARAITENVPFREEFRVFDENGEVRWLVGQGTTLHRDENGKPTSMIGVNYDVTDQKNLETELAQSNLELEARVLERTSSLEKEMRERRNAERALAHSKRFEMIGQLAGGVAHDFNNLLAVIGGNLELATMRTADERIVGLLNDALEAVEAGASLNRRLLSFARKRSLEPVTLIVNDRITKTRRLLERTLGENIILETELSSDLWPTHADIGEFDSAVLNLVLNARDAMPSGGRLSITTRNRTLSDAEARTIPDAQALDYVQISISDTGVGMAPHIREKAITPYFTTKDSGKGSGLGLSSVYGFASQSAGFVKIDSTEGKGTTVDICLPRVVSPSNVEEADSLNGDPPLGSGQLILLVEDDEKVRKVARKRLVELDYSVIEAATAADAIEVLETNGAVSLVFSDVRMPGDMSGHGLATWVGENRPHVRVLLTSGYNDLTAEELKDVKILSKPYSLHTLAFALRDAIISPPD